ncbi:MAG: AraC family ligand binding domain-containing protein, partial [Flavobacteriales bacterium]|nr:AraC family ligand binding domain-containing protein [Flavobacteriales bacterium]
MNRFKQYIPFEILEINTDVWTYPLHNHNYFEIIFIKKGIGTHIINNIEYNYGEKDIFLISPEQFHIFDIKEHSSFVYLKFTELLFSKNGDFNNNPKWIEKMEYIIFSPIITHSQIKYDETDRNNLFNLVDIILKEHHNYDSYNEDITLDALSLILNLIGRNINNSSTIDTPIKVSENSRVKDILSYIRLNVYNSENMKIENLAKIFNMSKNYISIFFKRHTGESL